jgi:hypothetical protein
MMTRDDFRKLIAGHFALMNGIERDSLTKYVEGGLFAFDFFQKNWGKYERFNRSSNEETQSTNWDKSVHECVQQKNEVTTN